ncbi:MAG TPA: cytochrome c3 family protein [Candidatus Sulfotelmatobacter sp.]|nr:cytochrome c3 family protein [Candidatus Sulfotelmatobacter sp.]
MHLRALVPACLGLIFLLASIPAAGQHPYPLGENSQCIDCHDDHATGNHVHPAVKSGCASCHQVENRNQETYVVLRKEKAALCFGCHQPVAFSYPHFPYTSGMCTRCHNPHASENAHLLRAKVNEVCLQCHLRKTDSVPSPYMPTISLVSDNQAGHPYERHPVGKVRDPLSGDEMSCLSCHVAHGGVQVHLLKMGAAIPEDALNQVTETNDICRKCHLRLWGLDGDAGARKKNKKRDNRGVGGGPGAPLR